MIQRGTGNGIHAHADYAAEKKVAGESRGAGAGNIFRERDGLRLIPLLVDRHGDIGVPLGLNHAGRDAGGRDIESGNVRCCAGFAQPSREIKEPLGGVVNRGGVRTFPAQAIPPWNIGRVPLPSLFTLIHGIVRTTDSLAPSRATHEKV